MDHLRWFALQAAALTVVRIDWPVTSVQVLSAQGSETPISGDALRIALAETSKVR
jgi:hypothetical protein